MKKTSRLEFLKEVGRWSALAGLVGFGAVLFSRGREFSCNDQCNSCPKYDGDKCGVGRK